MNPAPPAAETDGTRGAIASVCPPTRIAGAALCGITLAFYHNLWLPGLVLIERDAFRTFLPFKQYLVERLSTGELPQWFPYEALGRSFIGITATGVFHPFTVLYAFFPVPDAYRLSTLLSCLLAACGAFALGRVLHFSRTGALAAGVTFALSGYVASATDNLVYLYSICVLPLFCAALEKALGRTPAWTVAPAVIWASVFLNGDVQTGYYYGFIALLWATARRPGVRLEAYGRITLIGGLAALLAGIQLGPAWAVFAGSERAHPGIFHEQALFWSTHPLRLLTVLASPAGGTIPLVDTGHLSFDDWQERYRGSFWAETLYLGIPAAGLACLGARRRPDLRVLAWLGGVSLLLALGKFGGLYEIFYHVAPFWSAFRYPEKLMGLVSFATAMLAGAGLDTLRSDQGRPTLWLAAALVCVGAWLGLRTETAGAWTAAYLAAPEAPARELAAWAARAFLYSAITALGVGMLVAGARRGRLRPELLLASMVAIVALDLARANLGAYHTAPVETATFIPPLAGALQSREGSLGPGRFRLVSFEEPRIAIPEHLEQALGYRAAVMVTRRQALDALHSAQVHVESARRYLTGYNTDLMAMSRQQISAQAAARYNVAYYIGLRYRLKDAQVAGALVAELRDYDLILFRNPAPVTPRAYLARRPEGTSSPTALAALFARPDFLSGETDVIETQDAPLPQAPTGGTAEIEQYQPEEVRIRVHTPQAAILILLDAFEDGWTATLDKALDVPILRANALVRAGRVPAGTHVVTFRYETPLLRAGAAASLAGVGIGLGLITHARRRTRQRRSLS